MRIYPNFTNLASSAFKTVASTLSATGRKAASFASDLFKSQTFINMVGNIAGGYVLFVLGGKIRLYFDNPLRDGMFLLGTAISLGTLVGFGFFIRKQRKLSIMQQRNAEMQREQDAMRQQNAQIWETLIEGLNAEGIERLASDLPRELTTGYQRNSREEVLRRIELLTRRIDTWDGEGILREMIEMAARGKELEMERFLRKAHCLFMREYTARSH